jgi:pyruvate dehydrogenase E2 component (dihydrolipoamide acetyltransferase)
MYKVIMPKLGMAQSYCVIDKWFKKVGDKIEKGDVILEVSTDKIVYEVEAKQSGYLLKTLRSLGEEVPVTEVIAFIGEKDERIIEEEKDIVNEVEPEKIASKVDADSQGVRISALAKVFAEKNNIDIAQVKGSGIKQRIMMEDVEEYLKEKNKIAEIKNTSLKIYSKKSLSGVRKVIAEKMVLAINNIPHISQSTKADVTKLVLMKEKISANYDNLTYTDLLIKIVALAIRDNIEVNSSLVGNEHLIYDDINIGFVVSIPEGVIIPVIYNCDKKSVFEIAEERKSLIEKSKQNKLSIKDISGGTFTISNLGMFNVRSLTAIIYPPQGAILTIGKIYSSAEVVNEEKIEIKKMLELTSTEDHRILDGAIGAKFLTRIVELLEDPALAIDFQIK